MKRTFNLRKWNSNSIELLQLINNKEESVAYAKTEKPNALVEGDEESFIKSTVGPTRTADAPVKTWHFLKHCNRGNIIRLY